jgi:uncharacterized membrane protein
MKDFILKRILLFIGAKMSGYKTYAGAAGKALAGLSSIVSGVIGLLGVAFPDQGLPTMDVQTAWGLVGAGVFAISSGLASAGIGHKLEKASDQRTAIAAAAHDDTARAGGLPPIS